MTRSPSSGLTDCRYIATDDDKDWASQNARSLDLIISTVSSDKMPLSGYLGLLKPKVGVLIQVGAPDGGNLPPVNAFQLLSGIKLGGSGIGSPGEIAEMLQLAADQKIKVRSSHECVIRSVANFPIALDRGEGYE